MKEIFALLAGATLAVGGTVAAAAPASATTVTHNCGSTAQMCVFYNSAAYGYGAEYGNSSNVRSFNPSRNGGNTYAFRAGALGRAGAGQTVWNNAGGAGNYSGWRNFAVCENTDYGGQKDVVPYGHKLSLTRTHNNDTSMGWI